MVLIACNDIECVKRERERESASRGGASSSEHNCS